MDARSLLALANLDKRDRYLTDLAKLQAPKKQDWRWVGFDSTIGMGIVRSGNITRMGKVLTNGYLVEGQPVEFNQDGQFGTIEGLQYIKPEVKRSQTFVPKAEEASIAILFEAYKDGSTTLGLYVGGLTPEPIEVSPPNGDLGPTNAAYILDNLGEGNYYVASNQFIGNIGIVGRWLIPNNDLKVSPPTQVPEGRVNIRQYVGAGIFVGLTEFTKGHTVGFFGASDGPASWTNGVRVDSPTVQHPVTVFAAGSSVGEVGIANDVSGSGFYALPNGTQIAVSYTSGASYINARTLFAEGADRFLYKVETYTGTFAPQQNSAGRPDKIEYFYVTGSITVKVAESARSAAGQQVSTLGNATEIEVAFTTRSGARLIGTVLYSVQVDNFNLSGEPSDPYTGSYTVEAVDLFGPVSSTVYQVEPIPQNYNIPIFLFGRRIWNASFNFQ